MDAQTVRQKLDNLLIPYTEESYLNYVTLGQVRIVKLFIKAGINVDSRDRYNNTALALAAVSGNKAVVQLLISAGADVNGDSDGLAPLINAIDKGHLEIAEMLIKAGASIHIKDGANWTILLCAVRSNFLELAEKLIAAGLDVNQRGGGWGRSFNALELAAKKGNIEMLKLLLRAGAKINGDDCCIVASAIESRKPEVVKFVLDAGGDVNAGEGHYQSTALMNAIYQNSRMVKLLLDAGADMFQENIHHRTVYMEAVWRRIKNKKILKLIEPAKPRLTDFVYDAGLYWGEHGPICENCLVWMEWTRTEEYDEVYRCYVEETNYFLKEGEYYKEAN